MIKSAQDINCNEYTTLSTDYTVNLTPPDITRWRSGNTGIEYFHKFEADAAGPHVCLTAVVHGNELCGALALDWLLDRGVRPNRGTLSLGFVNVPAFLSFDPGAPSDSRFVDEDFNRLWSEDVLDGERNSVELKRAREIRPFIDTVDYLLDIHSMQHPAPSLMMCGPERKGYELGMAIASTEWCITDAGHAAGKRMRDYNAFAIQSESANALLVECGQHWDADSERVARQTAFAFLRHFDVVSDEYFEEELNLNDANSKDRLYQGATTTPRHVEVSGPYTIENDQFEFVTDFTGMEVIEKAGTVIGHDGGKPVKTPYDHCVLIMPSRRLYRGQSAVRFGRIMG